VYSCMDKSIYNYTFAQRLYYGPYSAVQLKPGKQQSPSLRYRRGHLFGGACLRGTVASFSDIARGGALEGSSKSVKYEIGLLLLSSRPRGNAS